MQRTQDGLHGLPLLYVILTTTCAVHLGCESVTELPDQALTSSNTQLHHAGSLMVAHISYLRYFLLVSIEEEVMGGSVLKAKVGITSVFIQFPLYWFSMPAIMKGWMDRVLVQGFAHDFPKCFDSGLLKNKLALLSFTTGGDKGMYSKGGASGDIRYLLWPMQHGILHFCGFSILTPQICYAPESMTEDERVQILSSWMKRLRTIWEEKPIKCTPEWYYQ
ncbi:Ribosyldihydronicotinamide dehydrogenase [quinone] [Varanus komodoensis]|nr:Ribosyldihydronicotinamide dehydrogenase [quinone] [Varanus komodoensis]